IAKRIEAGREAMIAGLCESPLTFQAIIIWRDELNEGNVLLRDIIDLEATHAGPDAKATSAPVVGAGGLWGASVPTSAAGTVPLGQTPAPGAGPATLLKPPRGRDNDEGALSEQREGPEGPGEGDFDDDDMENLLSLAAIEAELRPKVVATFDKIAD